MENWTALKWRVHDLIKAEALAFDDDDVSDVNRNPLPDHQRSKINTIGSDSELQIEKDTRVVHMSMGTVYEALFKAKMLDEEQEKKEENENGEEQYCQYHQRPVGHSIQDYRDFLDLVQEWMDEGRIEFCKEMKGQAVNVLQEETPKPVIIHYWGGGQQALTKASIHPIPRVVIKVPTPLWYISDKAVSWKYTNQVVS